ncbi:YafY family protein [Actinomadura sp. NAK00032]|uniref:helix-turn-helix transcriptional regulator n=1 Tax=Actinomadura sp. NAK00032 TaxID=2742128 RepID=UPI0020C8133D|nr:WYL domain-containing protein [Actinomadura sp. NAK00032]
MSRCAVEEAVAGGMVVRLSYCDAAGRRSDRVVEPAGLLTASGRWYLIAWCRTRRAGRGLRLDRIAAAAPTGERVQARDLAELLLGSAAERAVPPAALVPLARP